MLVSSALSTPFDPPLLGDRQEDFGDTPNPGSILLHSLLSFPRSLSSWKRGAGIQESTVSIPAFNPLVFRTPLRPPLCQRGGSALALGALKYVPVVPQTTSKDAASHTIEMRRGAGKVASLSRTPRPIRALASDQQGVGSVVLIQPWPRPISRPRHRSHWANTIDGKYVSGKCRSLGYRSSLWR